MKTTAQDYALLRLCEASLQRGALLNISGLNEKGPQAVLFSCPNVKSQRAETASTTHSAVMLTMRRTVADGVRMCTGRAQPSSTGPMATPLPAAVLTTL